MIPGRKRWKFTLAANKLKTTRASASLRRAGLQYLCTDSLDSTADNMEVISKLGEQRVQVRNEVGKFSSPVIS